MPQEKSMFKAASFVTLAAALALSSSAALAQQGNSSSWGSVGWGPVIPTQSLTPRERQWNFDNQAKYEAEDSAEWLRQRGMGPFSFFH
jgi:hypothetical protein